MRPSSMRAAARVPCSTASAPLQGSNAVRTPSRRGTRVARMVNSCPSCNLWYTQRDSWRSHRERFQASGVPASFRSDRGVAQPGRAPGSGPGGRRFKSSLPDHFWNQSVTSISSVLKSMAQGVVFAPQRDTWDTCVYPHPSHPSVIFRWGRPDKEEHVPPVCRLRPEHRLCGQSRRMYVSPGENRITCSSRPTVDTRKPRAQKCCPTKFRFRSPHTFAGRIALLPFMNPCLGGIEIVHPDTSLRNALASSRSGGFWMDSRIRPPSTIPQSGPGGFLTR